MGKLGNKANFQVRLWLLLRGVLKAPRDIFPSQSVELRLTKSIGDTELYSRISLGIISLTFSQSCLVLS